MWDRLKANWQSLSLLSAIIAVIVLYAGVPKRVEKVEADQAKQGEQIDDLKGWAREMQGYTRAVQQQTSQAVTRQDYERWTDERGVVWVCDPNTYDCRDTHNWWVPQ